MRTQLLLDLAPETPPGFANFVAGTNGEALGHLRELANTIGYRALYLWGEEGVGKTHLLHACANVPISRRRTFLTDGSSLPEPESLEDNSLILIDKVHLLSDSAQTMLFRLFNAARHHGLAIVLTGPCAPLELNLREDLRTRIGQSLIFQIHLLSDEEKRTALARHALQRGMRLDESVINYLMHHGRRDLHSLVRLLDQLDQLSLELKRQPTLPLLRELMQSPLELEQP